MKRTDAGGNASSERNDVPSKPPISPAARKFAEYLARRMQPMIEKAKQTQSVTAEQRERGVASTNIQSTGNQDNQ